MGLMELDKEYRSICFGESIEKRVEYCEDLIRKMQDRLTDNHTSTNHMRSLLLEVIASANKEIEMLESEKLQTK